MKNIAIIELDMLKIKLTIASVVKNSIVVLHQVNEPLNFVDDFKDDEMIKTSTIAEAMKICLGFKNLCDSYEVVETTCLAHRKFYEFKNSVSFYEQIYTKTALKFKEMTEDEEINGFYFSAINSVDVSRGILFCVNTNDTVVISYSKRSIFDKLIIPYGTLNILQKLELENVALSEMTSKVYKFFKGELSKISWLKSREDDVSFVGMGSNFLSICKLTRKLTKYPVDIENMYNLTKGNFDTTYNFLLGLDLDKTKKIKGISQDRSDLFACSLAIYKAIFECFDIEDIFASKLDLSEGELLYVVNPSLTDKPYPDILGNSLDILNEYYLPKPNNNEHVYYLTVILYKQLKVLHKLPRTYVKALRIASSMYNCGNRVNFYENNKAGYNIILNSHIMGASHKDIVLSAFIILCTKLDDFNLSEWIKYKDILTEDDISAVKKLAVIINLAASLDIFRKKRITDVTCDMLGDSIIIKTQTETPAPLEIKEGMKNVADFKKVFKKNLELL